MSRSSGLAEARIAAFEQVLHSASATEDSAISGQIIAGDCTASWGPRELAVSADCKSPARLRISQLFFPLWKFVSSGGSTTKPAIDASPQGLIELTLLPGKKDFNLVFEVGRPERWGALASVTLLVLGMIEYILLWFIDFSAGRRHLPLHRAKGSHD